MQGYFKAKQNSGEGIAHFFENNGPMEKEVTSVA